MENLLEDYISRYISPEPEHLTALYRHTYLHRLYPRMCSGHVQGRMLKMLTGMIAPQRILELGTFTGYSALCMAEGMPGDAELHTVEIEDEWEAEIRSLFDSTPWGGRMHLHIGNALDIVPGLGGGWDMVFIDANKRYYSQYYRMVFPLVNKNGYILADNTLWNGKVAESVVPDDAQTRGIMEFNRMVAADPAVEVSIIPVRDGLTIIKKL